MAQLERIGGMMNKPKIIGCVGHDCDDCKKQKREMINLRKHLKALTDNVLRHLVLLDEEMKKPESAERGKRLAQLANALEMANDSARYRGLGIDFRKDNKDKERARVMRSNAELCGADKRPVD
jgi:hypothetical protein